ncbi:cobalt-precorrin-6A reductase [Neorhizobium alkalisoli]|uniref:Precorrin-6A reductase n=1 Tax=Neorhizobium alkalisoli TaxID=528178 RepID=A0A561PZ44_9HYPH|nr:cobalt-precorrin-6A reductase [Neorhizobium alkalisoli]TWF43392.1 precorrin-6A reductase [Neorhizobium alkalisoli]
MKRSILILGGTAEAKALAGKLARDPRFDTVLSLAGRTKAPAEQPVPVRIGGFGGAEGLTAYLKENGISALIDATHPYAARISANAAEAAEVAGVPLIALRRAAWERQEGDLWRDAGSVAEALGAIGTEPRRVFLTLGRQELLPFEAAPQHHYLVRSVDPVDPPLDLPNVTYLTSRGPFAEADEMALLAEHRIQSIVAKNSGGPSSYGKIAAARALGIPVVLIRRPVLPDVVTAETIDAVLAFLDHLPAPPKDLGE